MPRLTQSQLKELLIYDPETGLFTWVTPKHKSRLLAGTAGSNRYIRIWVAGARYQAHQLAWLYVYGYFPNEIDHINRDPHDNKLENLRDATRSENMKNAVFSGKSNGVYPTASGRFWAGIGHEGQTIYLGCFDDRADAVKARKQAEIEYGYTGIRA